MKQDGLNERRLKLWQVMAAPGQLIVRPRVCTVSEPCGVFPLICGIVILSRGTEWRISSDIHSRVKWGIANLIDEKQIAPLAAADFIFCRNVFIYFSESAIRRVVHSFAKYIRPPGYLFVGAAES